MKYNIIIEDIIRNIERNYDADELAYLCLTSKIENPLRDKIAFQLQNKLGNNMLICREWTNKRKVKSKSDIAILDFNDNVECIIEFKAHSSITGINQWAKEMVKDIKKAKDIASTTTEIYFVFFANYIDAIPDGHHFEHSIKYYNDLKKGLKKSLKEVSEGWKEKVSNFTNLNNALLTEIEINAGCYYKERTTIKCFIYGPYFK